LLPVDRGVGTGHRMTTVHMVVLAIAGNMKRPLTRPLGGNNIEKIIRMDLCIVGHGRRRQRLG